MDEELRLAIPPPRERSPIVLRRSIDKLERRIDPDGPSSPRRRGAAGRAGKAAGNRGGGGGTGATMLPPPLHLSHPTQRLTPAPPPLETPSFGGGGATIFHGPPMSARSNASGKGGTPRPAPFMAANHPPLPPQAGSHRRHSYQAAVALLPPSIQVEFHKDSLEALPMPSARRRGKAPRHPCSSLDSSKEHTEEVQDALARVGHLLNRPSLRKLAARILDSSLLPPDFLDDDETPEEALKP